MDRLPRKLKKRRKKADVMKMIEADFKEAFRNYLLRCLDAPPEVLQEYCGYPRVKTTR